MKNLITVLTALIMLSSCSKDNTTLVAYFSATGTTKAVAERIAKAADADLFEIKPVTPYTEADLDWRDSLSRSSVEMADPTSRPAIAEKVKNLDQYETVYIGFPIWWYTAPTIINTFIEENNLSGKTVKFFATSGSSDIRNAVKQFQNAYPDIKLVSGELLNNASDALIDQYVGKVEPEDNPVCGGYSVEREPSEAEVEMLHNVVGEGDMVITPLSVATQVVAGLNYKFWCRYEDPVHGESGHCWVTIYKDLQGQATLSNITKEP